MASLNTVRGISQISVCWQSMDLALLLSIQPENLSPFKPCTQQCRRQRKQTTDGKVINKKEQRTNRLYNCRPICTLFPFLYLEGRFLNHNNWADGKLHSLQKNNF